MHRGLPTIAPDHGGVNVPCEHQAVHGEVGLARHVVERPVLGFVVVHQDSMDLCHRLACADQLGCGLFGNRDETKGRRKLVQEVLQLVVQIQEQTDLPMLCVRRVHLLSPKLEKGSVQALDVRRPASQLGVAFLGLDHRQLVQPLLELPLLGFLVLLQSSTRTTMVLP